VLLAKIALCQQAHGKGPTHTGPAIARYL
jgi:hypothetical protein